MKKTSMIIRLLVVPFSLLLGYLFFTSDSGGASILSGGLDKAITVKTDSCSHTLNPLIDPMEQGGMTDADKAAYTAAGYHRMITSVAQCVSMEFHGASGYYWQTGTLSAGLAVWVKSDDTHGVCEECGNIIDQWDKIL